MKKTALRLAFKKRAQFSKSRPAIYIGVILVAILAAYAYKFRAQSIFSCTANGYSSDWYIAYCNDGSYADYEHGAFQFGLEPSAEDFARKADVLFLGNSRLQIAFSTAATSDWFSTALARYYLLGFSYDENMIFADEILYRIHPHARVYVINVDTFFYRSETAPVKSILHDPGAQNRYEEKRRLQHIHEPVCKRFPAICGNSDVIFRSRETGAYIWLTSPKKSAPVSYDPVINQELVDSNTAAAIDFLSHLPVDRKCVILTMVPTVGTKTGNVNAIAAALGDDLITPDIPAGLQTFDGSHLDQASAERWSQAFFEAAGARIRSCFEEQQ
jgi:hypothetical protein